MCQEEECSKHMSWYAQAITTENRALQHENAIMINALREVSRPDVIGGLAWGMREMAHKILKQVEA